MYSHLCKKMYYTIWNKTTTTTTYSFLTLSNDFFNKYSVCQYMNGDDNTSLKSQQGYCSVMTS